MTRDRFFFWDGDTAVPVTARQADRDYRDTDAGTDDTFVVRAATQSLASQGARDWLANRADDSTNTVPDHCGLEERAWKPSGHGHTYMILWVA